MFSEVLTDDKKQPIYLRTTGPTALAFNYKQLEGHGKDRHPDGFGAPIGNWKETTLREGENAKLEFESGVTVEGRVERLVRQDGKLLIVTFSNCTVKRGDRVLFDPAWGEYDMAVGEQITSVFNGAADKGAYLEVALVPKERTIKVPSDESAGNWRISISRCATSGTARPVTNGSAKSGRHSKPNTPMIGSCRWRFLKSSTTPANKTI